MKKLSLGTHLIVWFTMVSGAIYVFNIAETEIKVVSNLLQCIAAFITLVYAGVNAYLQRKSALRIAWFLLAIAIFSMFLGYTTYSLDELVFGPESILLIISRLAAFPTYAFLLTAIIFAMIVYIKKGAGLTYRGHLPVFLAVTSSILYLAVIRPIMGSANNPMDLVLAIIAPIADFSLLLLTLLLIRLISSINRDAESRAWEMIALGLLVFVIGDSIYAVMSAKKLYQTGMLLDMSWITGLSILAVGLSEYIKASSKERIIDNIRYNVSAKLVQRQS